MKIPHGRKLTEITLKLHEVLKIGDDVQIQIQKIGDACVDVYCFAPKHMIIYRAEIENIKKIGNHSV